MAPPSFPKVPTGIPGLDGAIGGGFTKNSLITLAGATGSGRTTFAVQFLVNGFRQNQEPGLYLSFDEPKFSIFANMSSYDWDLPEMERNKSVVFIEYPHHELDNFLEQENALLELIDTLGVERVVFDSITPLAMLSEGDQRRRDMLKLINAIRRWGATTLIVAEDLTPADPNMPRSNVGVEAMTDGFIHLGLAREGATRVRTLEVVKMRGSAHEHLIHPCVIDSQGFRLTRAGAQKTTSGMQPPTSPRPGLTQTSAPRPGLGQTIISRPSFGQSITTKTTSSGSVIRPPMPVHRVATPGMGGLGGSASHPPMAPKATSPGTNIRVPLPPSKPTSPLSRKSKKNSSDEGRIVPIDKDE
jgi:circadian clock protein KaiC